MERRRVVRYICHSFRDRTERYSCHGSSKRAHGSKKVNMRHEGELCSISGDGGLHNKVKSSMISDIVVDRFGKPIVVPIERERGRRTVRIERSVRTYVVGHEFHRRCCMRKGESRFGWSAVSWRAVWKEKKGTRGDPWIVFEFQGGRRWTRQWQDCSNARQRGLTRRSRFQHLHTRTKKLQIAYSQKQLPAICPFPKGRKQRQRYNT